MLTHYKGELGEFDYDTKQYKLVDFTDTLIQFDYKQKHYLHYKGKELYGEKIQIPKGLKVANYLFYKTKIITQPEIPSTVESANSMFDGCVYLTDLKQMPNSVKSCAYMYYECKSLTEVSFIFPEVVIDAESMFCKCSKLHTARIKFHSNIDFGDEMFMYCHNLQNLYFYLPSNISSMHRMFADCDKLKRMLSMKEINYDYLEYNEFNTIYESCYGIKCCSVPKIVLCKGHQSRFVRLISCYNSLKVSYINSLREEANSVEETFTTQFLNGKS